MAVAVLAATLGACAGGQHQQASPARATGSTGPTPPASREGTSAPSGDDGSPTAPGGPPPTTAQPVHWSPCPGHPGWDCASLPVPLDHAHPGRTVDVALSRHRATVPARRVGSLLLNPGGPGASGIAFAYSAVDSTLDPQLVQFFDVIGFDPRGVGQSTPVVCVDGPTLDRLDHLPPAPTTPADVDAIVAGAKELVAGCQKGSGDLLPHVSTLDAARDLDDIRAALGDPKLSYLGFSYGTLLGATYASLFPGHVRALVLDSAIDPTLDEAAMSQAQAVGFEQNLDAFLADCSARGASCPFARHGLPTLRAAFDALMARINAQPIPAGRGRTLGPGEAFFGVALPLYGRSSWPALAQGLEDAERGDGATLMSFSDTYTGRHPDGTYDNTLEASVAINCLDHPAPGGPDAFAALARTVSREAPYFGAPVVWGAIPCAYWPVPPVTRPGVLHAPGAPPILVAGSTGDPSTPFPWAQGLAAQLGSGVLVTRRGEGHGAYLASACVRALEDDYLVTLAVPTPIAAQCTS